MPLVRLPRLVLSPGTVGSYRRVAVGTATTVWRKQRLFARRHGSPRHRLSSCFAVPLYAICPAVVRRLRQRAGNVRGTGRRTVRCATLVSLPRFIPTQRVYLRSLQRHGLVWLQHLPFTGCATYRLYLDLPRLLPFANTRLRDVTHCVCSLHFCITPHTVYLVRLRVQHRTRAMPGCRCGSLPRVVHTARCRIRAISLRFALHCAYAPARAARRSHYAAVRSCRIRTLATRLRAGYAAAPTHCGR